MSARALELAGLDGGDVASASHPYLHLAAARMRRARTARLTPGGLPQPPEVMGVDADPRVPNVLQPMSGELVPGREVGEGRPAYFGAFMPAPTGVSNGQMDQVTDSEYGAPAAALLEATASDRFDTGVLAGLGSSTATSRLAPALPQFAAGGVLDAGRSGLVGEAGPEVITTLLRGGARVTPLSGSQASQAVGNQPELSGLGGLYGAPPGLTPGVQPVGSRLQQGLDAYHSAVSSPPPGLHAAADKYNTAVDAYESDRAPDRNDPAYIAARWRLAGGLARNPQPAARVENQWAPDPFAKAEADWQLRRRQELAGLEPQLRAAQLERGRNRTEERAWQQERRRRANRVVRGGPMDQ